MLSESALTNIVTITVLLVLVATFFIGKRMRYAVNAIVLFIVGLIPLLYKYDVIGFTFGEAGIWKYLMPALVVFAAENLFKEGLNAESGLKWVFICFSVFVAILVTVPALNQLGALTFSIPKYPSVVDSIVYVSAALLLSIGIFISPKEKE